MTALAVAEAEAEVTPEAEMDHAAQNVAVHGMLYMANAIVVQLVVCYSKNVEASILMEHAIWEIAVEHIANYRKR